MAADDGRRTAEREGDAGLQVFTGQNLTGMMPRDVGKGGVVYQKYYGFCLEPSHFPDSPNQPSFPSTVLDAGATYEGKIVYRFSTR